MLHCCYFGAKVTLLCTNTSNCVHLFSNGSAQTLQCRLWARCELSLWLDTQSPNALKPERPFLPHIQSVDKTNFEFGFTSVLLLSQHWSEALLLCEQSSTILTSAQSLSTTPTLQQSTVALILEDLCSDCQSDQTFIAISSIITSCITLINIVHS